MLDMLSGGTIGNFSVMAMGPYPYITAQIILQLLAPIIPGMEQRQREDPQGARRWMERWTYYIFVPMTAGTMFSIWLGELISEYGLRNQGLSLIIFAGIVSGIPGNLIRMVTG